MKKRAFKSLVLLIFFFPLLIYSQTKPENEKNSPGNTKTFTGTNGISLIQTFPPLPVSGRNGSFLGETIAALGDVNGDSYDDFAIGIKFGAVYPSGEKLGKVYVYFGGNSLSNESNPAIILTGEVDSDRFGCSVASAGDVNKDGFKDIIVGAYYNSAASLLAGRAYLYFGGQEMDNVPDAVFTGEGAMDYFGISVSSAGDVNNDGFSDMLVGASFNNRGSDDAGAAYLYLGGTAPDNIPDLIFTGETELDNFGNSVASAGDVNNDGFSDVIIAAKLNDRAFVDGGSVYLFMGGPGMDNVPDLIFTGNKLGGHFGTSTASGDVNNDGYSDIIIGNPTSEIFYAGESFIYFGGPAMDNSPDIMLAGESGFDNFGACVSNAGDVNKDGFTDIIVGATAGSFIFSGRVYLYYGSAEMDSIPDIIIEGENSEDFFGISAAGADVNNDGYSDVLSGAYMNDGGGIDAGRAYIYLGGAPMNNTADIIFTGEKNGDSFGISVSSAGDVNNDGFSDLIAGAFSNDDKAPDAGAAYLYYGGNEIENTPRLTFTGDEQTDGLGVSVSAAGDLNNDGFSDIVIGSYFNGLGGIAAGSAYIYFGGTNMDNTADLILTGTTFENFGNAVASAGDVNNDGFSDLIVGAYASSFIGFQAGRAYLFFGGNPMDNVPDLIFNGEATVDNFGNSVASAGDLNNDGFSDIIIGANLNDAGGSDAGRAYIYLGGPNMDNTADVILEAESSLGRFGTSVASAGDVNHDGFSDVIAGAQLAGPGAEGRAYLYFGGAPMNNSPDLIFTGEALSDGFGSSVSAGDINNDGFSDILIGAYNNDGKGYNSGKVYIYSGGTVPDNIPDAVINGQASSDYFGVSVATAGDVNNDGYSDIFIGASGNCAVGYERGRAYLFAGSSIITGIKEKNLSAAGFNLHQSYPNPFNPETRITFELPEPSEVRLVIYDILGREIAELENNYLTTGFYERNWKGFDNSGSMVSSGIYFYKLSAKGHSGKDYSKVMKMMMIK